MSFQFDVNFFYRLWYLYLFFCELGMNSLCDFFFLLQWGLHKGLNTWWQEAGVALEYAYQNHFKSKRNPDFILKSYHKAFEYKSI
jgi:hypothetical protein